MPDREKVIKGVHDARRYLEDREWVDKSVGVHIDALNDALTLLKEQESLIHFLEHQREKGHWIYGKTNGHGWMKCSQCCVSQDGQTSCYLFCPCCGADMSEVGEL